jgi:uncharacterized protein (TIGR02246 family)
MHGTRLAVLPVVLLLAAPSALAGPKEDVADATRRWGETLARNNPDEITALYAKEGVLWGTISPRLSSGPVAIRAYFVGAFEALPQVRITFGDGLIRVYGDTAINTGYYTFAYVKDGEPRTIPARYSFTYVKDGNTWMIVDHHSSAVPPPPQ